MALPDDLPPASLDITYKLILYFGILYIITTAITAWLITRRRSFPKQKKKKEIEEMETLSRTEVRRSRPMTFDDTQDTLSGLKVQVEASESALAKLRSLHDNGEISENAYSKLSDQYTNQVNNLTEQINDILQSDIESSSGEIIKGVKDEEIDELEADLERQLMDLEDDESFLRPRPKKSLEDALQGESRAASQPSRVETPSPPSQPSARAPEPPSSQPSARAPEPPSSQPSGPTQPTPTQPSAPSETKIPTPSSQKSEPTPARPAAASGSTPPVPKSSGPQSQPSQESTPSSIPSPTSSTPETTSVQPSAPSPPPPPKSKSQPTSQPAAPATETPQPTQPEEPEQQISAEQPMKVDAEDDGMFAKSTSIAALRMDMLRELARLKKLIDEDE